MPFAQVNRKLTWVALESDVQSNPTNPGYLCMEGLQMTKFGDFWGKNFSGEIDPRAT